MKKNTTKVVLASLCLLFFITASAQTSSFFYTTNDSKVMLTQVSSKYTVEYPNGLYNSNEYLGEHLFLNYYSISENYLSNINTYGANPIVHKIFKTDDGFEIGATNQLVLKFKDGVSLNEKNNLIQTNNLTYVKSTPSYELYTVSNTLTASQTIYESNLVQYCLPNFLTTTNLHYNSPSDPYYNKQYYLNNTGQIINDGNSGTSGADINIEPAWDITLGDSNIVVAVIDLGFTDHPDLPISRQVRPKGCNISNYNGTFPPDNPRVEDYDNGAHGNACMGIIAATHNNNIGIAGVAPKCKIMTIRVDIGGPILPSDYSDAIDMAVDSGAHIINCSWGAATTNNNFYPFWNFAIQRAIDKGVSVVFSAGNNGNIANHNKVINGVSIDGKGYVEYPANAPINGLISVGGSDRYDKQVNYSPTSNLIDITATTTKAVNSQIAGEAFDIWTLDFIDFHGYNTWFDSVSSYDSINNIHIPLYGEMKPNYGYDSLNFTGRFSGTSAAAPQVAGVLALMKSVNSCLKPKQLKDILIHTANKIGGYKYNWEGRSQNTGFGKLDAEKAVLAAQSMHEQGLDLFLKDHNTDFGVSSTVGSGSDNSPDVWVRRQPDGFINQRHENPLYHINGKVYVYVRVRNKSCTDHDSVTDKGQLALFWNRSATVGSWGSWAQIAVKNLPDIAAGKETIIEIEWNTPTPNTPLAASWDACLVARIQHITVDPFLNANPINNLALFVGQNNNATLKNFSVIEVLPTRLVPGNLSGTFYPHGKYVDIGNSTIGAVGYDFKLEVPNLSTNGSKINEVAEVKVTFDEDSWTLFSNANAFSQDGVSTFGKNSIVITKPEVTFSNIIFPANKICSIHIGASFWSEGPSEDMEFAYKLTQTEAISNIISGVQNYLFIKEERHSFIADAGTDKIINFGGQVTLSATSIGESAIYNWYNADDSIVYTGQDYTFYPFDSSVYKLQVVAKGDGFMDYDEVAVHVKKQFIISLSPNPASSTLTVEYEATNASSASVEILPVSGGTPITYTINTSQSIENINVSSLASGYYTVTLLCDNNVVDTKMLLIQ